MFKQAAASKAITVTSGELTSMSQDRLYQLFTNANWSKMNEASRLAALQEAENRQARADGRPPVKVQKGSREEFRHPDTLGGYNPYEKVIRLNYRYIEGKSPTHTGAGALSTILHEGRHAYQNYLVDKGVTSDSPVILKEWLTETVMYVPPEESFLIYAIQSLEDDARRFARKEMQKILGSLLLCGIDDQGFRNEYAALLQEEAENIMMIQEYLTIDDIDDVAHSMRLAMETRFPNLDLSNMSLFDNARLVLESKVDSAQDVMDLLDKMDRLAQERVSALNKRISDKMRVRKMKG